MHKMSRWGSERRSRNMGGLVEEQKNRAGIIHPLSTVTDNACQALPGAEYRLQSAGTEYFCDFLSFSWIRQFHGPKTMVSMAVADPVYVTSSSLSPLAFLSGLPCPWPHVAAAADHCGGSWPHCSPSLLTCCTSSLFMELLLHTRDLWQSVFTSNIFRFVSPPANSSDSTNRTCSWDQFQGVILLIPCFHQWLFKKDPRTSLSSKGGGNGSFQFRPFARCFLYQFSSAAHALKARPCFRRTRLGGA